MRVVHVYKDYHPVIGGIEGHVRLLAECQARQNLDVTVLVASPSARTQVANFNGVRVMRAARLATFASTPLSPVLVVRLRRLECDLVHLHLPYPLGDLAYALSGRGRPLVVTWHSDVVRQRLLGRLLYPLLIRTLRQAGAVIATSPPYLENSPALAPFRAKCRVIPLGVDTARFDHVDAAAVEALRRQHGPRLVLFVGRLRYYKGVDVLIRAMTRVEGTLLVAGDGSEGPRLRALAQELSLGERVRFLGDVEDTALPALYHAAGVAVLPSIQRGEAFGLALVEAMACGRPVVSTELGTGTSWVNQDGVTGLVVPRGNPVALAAALERVLRDPEWAARLGVAGRARACSEFDAGTMTDRTIALYRQVLGEG